MIFRNSGPCRLIDKCEFPPMSTYEYADIRAQVFANSGANFKYYIILPYFAVNKIKIRFNFGQATTITIYVCRSTPNILHIFLNRYVHSRI